MVWMHARCRIEPSWCRFGERDSVATPLVAASRDYHSRYARVAGALHHLGSVLVETVVCEVGADVN
jgi:hypothetical protein